MKCVDRSETFGVCLADEHFVSRKDLNQFFLAAICLSEHCRLKRNSNTLQFSASACMQYGPICSDP